MSYVYLRTPDSPDCYTVGFFDPTGYWHAESDHTTEQEAANRVRWLNGGNVFVKEVDKDMANKPLNESRGSYIAPSNALPPPPPPKSPAPSGPVKAPEPAKPATPTDANPRLIAAAPELLEACKTVWNKVLTEYSVDSPVRQKVEAAIAKAEGKEAA